MSAELTMNALKAALGAGQPQIGLWSTLASPVGAEIVAGAGFDWVLLDTEHAPNDVTDIHRLLQAMQGSATSVVVRPSWNDAVLFKRLLDIGVRSFVVPFVQSAAEASRAVAATRYPPAGIRGVATTTRANQYGRVKDYLRRANEEICVIVQIETRLALDNYRRDCRSRRCRRPLHRSERSGGGSRASGDNAHPDVRAAIDEAIGRIRAAGKAPGILAGVEADARHWLALGCLFVGVGNDAGVLARQTEALAAKFKTAPA